MPNIEETNANSKNVGTTLNTIADNTKFIPLEPLSIVLERAPKNVIVLTKIIQINT